MSEENYEFKAKHMLNKAEDYYNEQYINMHLDTKVFVYLFSALVYAVLRVATVLAYGNR